MEQKLVVFLKWPEKGKVKTRLASAIGEEEAASVYKKLAEETVKAVRPLAGQSADVVIAFDPPERETEIIKWIREPFQFLPQGAGNLGDRLSRIVHAVFRGGAEKVVVVGSDCPGLDAFTVNEAFRVLSRKDIVLGPTEDGGYYLVGLKQANHTFLFNDISWSTPDVLRMTLKKAESAHLSHDLLPEKFDVDTPEDLRRLSTSNRAPHPVDEKISIIVPTFNEEDNIESLLLDLTRRHTPCELIVADCGSRDRTVEIASRYAHVVRSEKGRAVQMNTGAAAATGDILLFLHADTRLPENAPAKIREALGRKGKNSGRFRMSFGHPHPLLRFYEFQTRFHLFSYGDQGFFVRKKLFQELGGFRVDVPFEDIDFYRRLRKRETPVIIQDPVITSPRRFLQTGVVKQKLINISLATMYYLGFDVQTIRKFQQSWYKDDREYARAKNA